jgi:hypothetical protein
MDRAFDTALLELIRRFQALGALDSDIRLGLYRAQVSLFENNAGNEEQQNARHQG